MFENGPKPTRNGAINRLLRDLIHEKTGVFFEDNRTAVLLGKLEPLLNHPAERSFLEIYYSLRDNNVSDWTLTWDLLAVTETYFWREYAQIKTLVTEIIPEWFQKSRWPYRIWCAASATGEEPYTIAISLIEAGLISYPIEIFASDASPAVIEHAQRGVYRERAFRTLPIAIKNKYFTKTEHGWQLAEEVMNRVTFRTVNLSESSEVSQMARVPAIFCRNVFIYFSAHAIRQTVATMAGRMPRGGHLFVGASESLLRLTTDFELQEIDGALVYVRT